MSASDPGAKCEATNVRGERCAKRAVRGRFCLTHAGVQDMRELGRKGGKVSPQTKLRKAADDELREQAREVLARALRGEEVPKTALDSARSLFSYRADAPPNQSPRAEGSGGKVIGLALVLQAAAESRVLSASGLLDVDAEREMLERLSKRAEAVQEEPAPPPPLGKGQRERADRGSRLRSRPAAPQQPVALSSNGDGDFDESPEAVRRRRYGSTTSDSWRWT